MFNLSRITEAKHFSIMLLNKENKTLFYFPSLCLSLDFNFHSLAILKMWFSIMVVIDKLNRGNCFPKLISSLIS